MIQPLALLFYENLLPGTQLVNRLQDLGYRVSVIVEADKLVSRAEQDQAMVAIIDLAAEKADICAVITELKRSPKTGHIPVLAFAGKTNKKLQDRARTAGADLVAVEDAVLGHLPQLLEQVLTIE